MAEATLNGIITDDGGLPCEYRFVYSPAAGLGGSTPWSGGWLVTGDTFSAKITGLLGNTIYYFRAEARNSEGSAVGSILSFITTKSPISLMSVQVLPAINITENAARIRGMVVNSLGQNGQVRFHYGTTAKYGVVTAWQQGFTTGDEFHADIKGLAPETGYHYKAEFKASPPIFSGDATFWTLAEQGGMVLLDETMLEEMLEV
jgi:hypothetical protein